ncbi:MAG: thioredoxin domain-containing protein [Litorimonas sp.]
MKNALILPAALISTALILSACSNASDTTEVGTSKVVQVADAPVAMDVATDAITMNAKTKAVLVYADWCSSCKILDPKIKAVQAMGPMPGVEFVTLDYTDKNPDNFYAQAAAAGVEDAVRTELDGTIKTGWLLLVDVDDARVLSKVTKADDAAQITAKIKAALAAS